MACPHCHAEFADPGRVYCSQRCRDRAREQRKMANRLARERESRPDAPPRSCVKCAREFHSPSPTAAYCSPRCKAKAKESRRGSVNREGYVITYAPGRGPVAEHRMVMEAIIGRPLRDFENVHHLNGIRSDNRPENLELWTRPQPVGQRPQDLAKWVVETYPGEVFDWLAQQVTQASSEVAADGRA